MINGTAVPLAMESLLVAFGWTLVLGLAFIELYTAVEFVDSYLMDDFHDKQHLSSLLCPSRGIDVLCAC